MRAILRRAKRAAGQLTRIDVYRCLTRPWPASSNIGSRPPGIEIRIVGRPQLAAYSKDPAHEISAEFLRGLAGRSDLCLGAFDGDQVLGYCFFAVEPTPIDRYLRFGFPAGWVYAYKAFTQPQWRGRGVLAAILRDIARSEREPPLVGQPRGLITLALTRNKPSLQAFAKAGFKRLVDFPVLILGSRPAAIFRAGPTSDFAITKRPDSSIDTEDT